MYIRIAYPLFMALDNYGQPAAGYELYTYQAGTVATEAPTYSDKELLNPNTNPVILNERGEARLFTNTAIKLVFTIPGGDPTSPIWSEDYVTEQQGQYIVSGKSVVPTVNNEYHLNIVPPFTSIPEDLMVVMTPDADNQNTLGVTTFNGSGINDITFKGPYLGTDPGAIFTLQIQTACLPTPDPPVAALSAVAGVVTLGVHSVKVTFVSDEGETDPSDPSNAITADGTHKVSVTSIPIGPLSTTKRRLYMNKAAGAIWYLAAEIADNTTTTYDINKADADLVTAAPTANTTGSGTGADTVRWKKDGGVWTTSIALTAADQDMIEGMKFLAAQKTGHRVGDFWTVTVVTPARLNFCNLGADLIYKIVDGQMQASDGGDIKADMPAVFTRSPLNCWVHLNPSLPVLSSLIPFRYRKVVFDDYTIIASDHGKEVSCAKDLTITLPACNTVPGRFFYIFTENHVATIQVSGVGDKIYGPDNPAGLTSYQLYPGGPSCVQVVTNGVDWHIVTMVRPEPGPPGFMSRLKVINNVADPAAKLDISADVVVVTDGIGYIQAKSISVTVDIAINGPDGLDTGAAADGNWYYLYVIYNLNLTRAASLLSLSPTAPTMPSGYTMKKLVGAFYRKAGGSFYSIYQYEKRLHYVPSQEVVDPAPASLGKLIPPTRVLVASFATKPTAPNTITWGDGASNPAMLASMTDYVLDPAATQDVDVVASVNITGFLLDI